MCEENTWWDYVKNDMQSFIPSQEDEQDRNTRRRKIQGATS